MTDTVDLTDTYEPEEPQPAGPVEWAVERQGTDDGETTVETVAFDVPAGVLRVVDHRVPDDAEAADETIAAHNATVDDEWDVDPQKWEALVASSAREIEGGIDEEHEYGNIAPIDRVPDPDEEGVEAATVRLPLREGVAAQFAETMDRHDRDPEAHLRDLVTEAASVHAVPHLSSVDPERLSEERRERAGAVREAGRAEWIGRVARGEDVREVSRDVSRHTATAIERVTGETREDGESDERTR